MMALWNRNARSRKATVASDQLGETLPDEATATTHATHDQEDIEEKSAGSVKTNPELVSDEVQDGSAYDVAQSDAETSCENFALNRNPHRSVVLCLNGVRKIYGSGEVQVEALKGIDLNVYEGDYVAVMGPSGSGKSTLMHILGCLDVPTSGTYLIDCENVDHMGANQLAKIRNTSIGFVFQSFNLLPTMTAQRNVELPLMYAGVSKKFRAKRAAEVLARVGLGERCHHRPNQMSGGQQQRASIARAIVTNPALILADEPTGNLDSQSTEDVLRLFDELHDQGRTIVLITHEHDVASRAERVLVMRDGLLSEQTPTRTGEVA